MFGYVSVNPKTLSPEEYARFRACYCGMCHVLKAGYGNIGRATLSNDMTFLAMLLSSLYEPDETCYDERCVLHPLKKHACAVSPAAEYAADMNILLAWQKCADDVLDDNAPRARLGLRALQKPYLAVQKRYPRACDEVQDCLTALRRLEKEGSGDIDALARLSGRMLGAAFAWKDDVFSDKLREIGAALGRFIYLMDAWEDYDADARKKRFNPLAPLHDQLDYEQRVEDILTMEIAQCARAFEYLPLERDAKLLRNVLYSGVWGKYAYLREKRKETNA